MDVRKREAYAAGQYREVREADDREEPGDECEKLQAKQHNERRKRAWEKHERQGRDDRVRNGTQKKHVQKPLTRCSR